MRALLLAMFLVWACGGKKDDKPATGSSTPSGSANTPTGSGSQTAKADPPARSATCETACARRAECKVTDGEDVAKCAGECKQLADVYTADALAAYVKAPCTEVAQAEPAFRATVGCKQACAHRAKCIPEASDQKPCLGDCTVLFVMAGEGGRKVLHDYAAADCDDVKRMEPEFQQSSACIAGCKYVLGCGVEGTFPGCVVECAQNLEKQAITLDQIAQLQKTACDEVKKTVKLASAQAPPAATGGSCDALCANYENCKMMAKDACMKECATITNERVIAAYTAATCEQLRTNNVPNAIPNVGCMREGKQDCQAGMMCCMRGADGGRATVAGEQGQCLYAALCYRTNF